MRARFSGFTWTPIGHDPVLGAYRVLVRDGATGPDALAAIDQARADGYGVIRHPGGDVTVSTGRR
jgi:hypothetical protein